MTFVVDPNSSCSMPDRLPAAAFRVVRVAILAAAFLASSSPDAFAEPIPSFRIAADAYRNFVGNWDNAAQPVFMALIRTPAEYEAVFHPAAVPGAAKPFGPPPELFDREMILVVARVVDAPAADETVLEPVEVTAEGDAIELRYRFTPPRPGASFTIKETLVLRIPRRDVTTVRFVENDEQVGGLTPAAGTWSLPAVGSP